MSRAARAARAASTDRAGGRWILAALLALAALGACDSGHPERSGPHPEPVTLTVFAASSLTEAFEALAAPFEAAHPGVDVRPTFAGSQTLRLQIEEGAPADVFASANQTHMDALLAAGLVRDAAPFAENGLVVIVPAADPSAIATFEDLPRAARIVLGADNVPVGQYARQLIDSAGVRYGADFAAQVRANVVSEEANVRLVRAKVELGEADAAIVYRTDAVGVPGVRVVPVPAELDVRARYPIATVSASAHPELAAQFVAFVRSAEGRAVLVARGFEAPSEPSEPSAP